MAYYDKKNKIFAKLCKECFDIVLKNTGKELIHFKKVSGYIFECLICKRQLLTKEEVIKHRRYFCMVK